VVVLPLWGCCLCCCGHGEFEDVHSHGIESDRMERKADGALYPVQLDVLLVYYIESTPLELIRSPAMRVVVLALSSSLRPLWLPCTLSWVSTDKLRPISRMGASSWVVPSRFSALPHC
jgi:hypothetical protein